MLAQQYGTFLLPLLIVGVFYLVYFRPQLKAQAALKAQQEGLKRGDKVVTAGGIIGTVARVIEGSTEVEVDIAPNVRVSVVRTTITTVLAPKAANDSKAG